MRGGTRDGIVIRIRGGEPVAEQQSGLPIS